MLITRFNQLIRSRIVWAAVGVIVSLSFVGVSVSRSGCDRGGETRGIEGWLYGKPVKTTEFLLARYFESRSLGQQAALSEDEAQELRLRTWRRLVALREAERLGLTVTFAELREIIARDPTFAVNGAFNRERYRSFVLNQMRMPLDTFEEYLRQEATLHKLLSAFGMLSWTPADEVDRRMSALTDKFDVQYVTFKSKAGDTPPVSREVAREFFEQHRELFRIPEQVKVKYVIFPVSNYLSSAQVSEEEIFDYYQEHIAEYSTTDTNNTPVARPLTEVRSEIESLLLRRTARFLGRDAATEFCLQLLPDERRGRKGRSFDEAARVYGLSVCTTELFTADDELPGIEVPHAFAEAAFKLDPNDPESYFSDAVIGENEVYVLAIVEKKEARDPDFDEVAEKAATLATKDAQEKALLSAAETTRSNILERVARSVPFADAAKELGLAVQTTGTFVAYMGLPTNMPNGQLIAETVTSLDAGELSAPAAFEGGVLLAYVANRQPGEPGTVQMLRPQFQRTLDSMNAVLLFREWQDQMLAKAQLRDVRATPPTARQTNPGEDEAPVELDL